MSYVADPSSTTVAAVLMPGERPRVDAAGNGLFAVLHRDSIPDAVRAVRERPVDAVLVSVHRCGADQMEVLGHLVREFPSIPTVALVSQHDPGAIEMLLRLGASGVRQVVDVTSPAGWSRLRQVVGQPATRAVARIQAADPRRPVAEAPAGRAAVRRGDDPARARRADRDGAGGPALGAAEHADVAVRAGGPALAQELPGRHPAAARGLPVRDRGAVGRRRRLPARVQLAPELRPPPAGHAGADRARVPAPVPVPGGAGAVRRR